LVEMTKRRGGERANDGHRHRRACPGGSDDWMPEKSIAGKRPPPALCRWGHVIFFGWRAVNRQTATIGAEISGHHPVHRMRNVSGEHRSTGARPVVAVRTGDVQLAVSHGPAGTWPAVADHQHPQQPGGGKVLRVCQTRNSDPHRFVSAREKGTGQPRLRRRRGTAADRACHLWSTLTGLPRRSPVLRDEAGRALRWSK